MDLKVGIILNLMLMFLFVTNLGSLTIPTLRMIASIFILGS